MSNKMEEQERINKTYSNEVAKYDDLMLYSEINFEKPRRELFNEISFTEGEKILEMPVGTGLNLELYPANLDITCLDINNDMMGNAIKEAKRLDLSTSFLLGNAEYLPFKNNTFDKAIIAYGLSAIPNREQALKELHRVVRPNGQIGIVDFKKHGKTEWMGKIDLGKLIAPYSHNIISQESYDVRDHLANRKNFFTRYLLKVD